MATYGVMWNYGPHCFLGFVFIGAAFRRTPSPANGNATANKMHNHGSQMKKAQLSLEKEFSDVKHNYGLTTISLCHKLISVRVLNKTCLCYYSIMQHCTIPAPLNLVFVWVRNRDYDYRQIWSVFPGSDKFFPD